MLRIHFIQHWFNLSDPAAEEALYDSSALSNLVMAKGSLMRRKRTALQASCA